MEFVVGERVKIAPDFSNDGFEPFEATIIAIDNTAVVIREDDGLEMEWMLGNVFKLT